MAIESVYRRPLPDDLVAFASEQGRLLFREALATGDMEGFFPLAEQFHTQADPSYCGLGSLVVALNALAIDPGRLWKGPWRWFTEELLDCCAPLDRVRERGLSLDELGCLARCNGADVRVRRGSVEELRADVRSAARSGESIVVASYTRRALGQTGAGHFSPVGGHHAARDLALLLDVARFKYPPHWVPLERLHAAMQDVDPTSGKSRGWLVLGRRAPGPALLFSFSTKAGVTELVHTLGVALPAALAAAADARAALAAFAHTTARTGTALDVRDTGAPEHAAAAACVRTALEATWTYAVVREALGAGAGAGAAAEGIAALALAAPKATWATVPDGARAELDARLERDRSSAALATEIRRMREQLEALAELVQRASPSVADGGAPRSGEDHGPT